jgi:hypothetical protein
MKTRRLAIAGAAVAAIIGVAGCGPKDQATSGATPAAGASGAAAATTAPADPKSEFEAAVAQVGDSPVKIKMSMVGGITMTGGIDAQGRKADITMDLGPSGGMDMRQVGTDLYVKAKGQVAATVGGKSGKWMHIDTAKVPESSALNVQNNDPKITAKILAASTDVQKTGDKAFAGKVDLTKSPTFKASSAAAMGSIADKLKAVPFTAKLDSQGRLSSIVFDLEAIAPGAGKMTTDYSDFGTPVVAKAPPASEVIPMPSSFRKAMGA